MSYFAEFESFKAKVQNRANYSKLAGFKVWQPIHEVDDLNAFLDGLTAEYCDVEAETRDRIRALFEDPDSLGYLHQYITQCPARLRACRAPQMLVLGLAAISISDMRPDFRDTLYELGYLYKAADEVKMDQPLNYFRKIANLSNQAGNPSTAKIIAEFDLSAVFRELGFTSSKDLISLVRDGDLFRLRNCRLASSEINCRFFNGETPLIVAAKRGDCSMIQYLIELGADVNFEDERGIPPVAHAACMGHWRGTQALIDAGANVKIHLLGVSFMTFVREHSRQALSKKLEELLFKAGAC